LPSFLRPAATLPHLPAFSAARLFSPSPSPPHYPPQRASFTGTLPHLTLRHARAAAYRWHCHHHASASRACRHPAWTHSTLGKKKKKTAGRSTAVCLQNNRLTFHGPTQPPLPPQHASLPVYHTTPPPVLFFALCDMYGNDVRYLQHRFSRRMGGKPARRTHRTDAHWTAARTHAARHSSLLQPARWRVTPARLHANRELATHMDLHARTPHRITIPIHPTRLLRATPPSNKITQHAMQHIGGWRPRMKSSPGPAYTTGAEGLEEGEGGRAAGHSLCRSCLRMPLHRAAFIRGRLPRSHAFTCPATCRAAPSTTLVSVAVRMTRPCNAWCLMPWWLLHSILPFRHSLNPSAARATAAYYRKRRDIVRLNGFLPRRHCATAPPCGFWCRPYLPVALLPPGVGVGYARPLCRGQFSYRLLPSAQHAAYERCWPLAFVSQNTDGRVARV